MPVTTFAEEALCIASDQAVPVLSNVLLAEKTNGENVPLVYGTRIAPIILATRAGGNVTRLNNAVSAPVALEAKEKVSIHPRLRK